MDEEWRPITHICIDCGALGFAGGYHDHGDGQAGETTTIAAMLVEWRRANNQANEISDLKMDCAGYREALEEIAWVLTPDSEVEGVDPADAYRAYNLARIVLGKEGG